MPSAMQCRFFKQSVLTYNVLSQHAIRVPYTVSLRKALLHSFGAGVFNKPWNFTLCCITFSTCCLKPLKEKVFQWRVRWKSISNWVMMRSAAFPWTYSLGAYMSWRVIDGCNFFIAGIKYARTHNLVKLVKYCRNYPLCILIYVLSLLRSFWLC